MSAATRSVGLAPGTGARAGSMPRARTGGGSLVLVGDEAAVRKTGLVAGALSARRDWGFTVPGGRFDDDTDPCLPLITAFPVTAAIEGAHLIYRDGRVIACPLRRAGFAADAEVVSGMLPAIQDFIARSFIGTPGGALREERDCSRAAHWVRPVPSWKEVDN